MQSFPTFLMTIPQNTYKEKITQRILFAILQKNQEFLYLKQTHDNKTEAMQLNQKNTQKYNNEFKQQSK